MMPGLVLELQRDALNSSVPSSGLLRKALVVSKKLGIDDFRAWIEKELNGYEPKDEIPKYREVWGQIKAWNPYNGWIPLIIQDTKIAKQLRQRTVRQSIRELESLVDNRKEEALLTVSYPPEVENMLMDDDRFQPFLHIGASNIHGIIDSVRNTVLEWSLKLEEEGILGVGMSFSKQEKVKARTSNNINIHNFQGVFGDVTESTVFQDLTLNVKAGDFDSLSDFLKSKNVQEEDIAELAKAVETDPPPKDNSSLGNKVSDWIGKMVSKAATGLWQIGVEAASNVLSKAICAYYGI